MLWTSSWRITSWGGSSGQKDATGALPPESLHAGKSQRDLMILSPMASAPELRAVAVQTEAAVQSGVGDVHPLRGVFPDRLRERIQQAPSGRLGELLVRGILEFLVHRYNIRAVDCTEFCGSDDSASDFVVVVQIRHFQVLADILQYQELVFELIDSAVHQIAQLNPRGMAALQNHAPAERHVRTADDRNSGCQPHGKALVVAVSEPDAAAPFQRGTPVDLHHAEQFRTLTCQTELLFQNHPLMPKDVTIRGFIMNSETGELKAVEEV